MIRIVRERCLYRAYPFKNNTKDRLTVERPVSQHKVRKELELQIGIKCQTKESCITLRKPMTCSDALCATFSASTRKITGNVLSVTIVVCEHEHTHLHPDVHKHQSLYICNNDVKLCCKYKVRCLYLPLHPAITPNYFPG